jgi:hypothetical protein
LERSETAFDPSDKQRARQIKLKATRATGVAFTLGRLSIEGTGE